ncbi:MAG: DUF202 domain-containing protein [Oscillospiraceae bacterium]
MAEYKNYENGEMILRDYLALDRTKLANKRTLLAYIRTFIGLVGSGVAMFKVFENDWIGVLGCVFMAAGPVFLIMGIIDYSCSRASLKSLEK